MTDYWQPPPPPPSPLGIYRTLTPSSGLRISPLILGGMSLGAAWSSGGMGSMSKPQAFSLLDAFASVGGNFIDTANSYQNEESEKWIGEWMDERKNRDRMVVATKWGSDYRSHSLPRELPEGQEGGDGARRGVGTANYAGNSRKSLFCSVEESLKKLRTNYIDILYLHWWDWTASPREVMDSLHVLVQQGKVLYLGISDTPAWVVAACNTYALQAGKTPFVIYQGRWNLLRRDLEREVIPMCRHFGMAIAPWDVLGGGKFQSRKQVEEREKNKEGLRSFVPGTGDGVQSEEERRVSEALEKVAGELAGEGEEDVSVQAVALAYVMAKAANVFPIVGGRKVEHLKANIKALEIELTEEQIKYLEGASGKPFEIGFPMDFLGDDPTVTGSSFRIERTAAMKWPDRRR